MDGPAFNRRLNEWTPEQLAPYQGKFVVFTTDGETILAAAATPEELYKVVDRLGIKECVETYIPTDEEILGGFR
jgi:hypothetical protein